VAAAILAFYGFVYLVQALMGAGEWTQALGAMAAVYWIGFFGVVAGYFWARWYAIGVGLQGVITTTVGLWQIGAEPVLLFLGGTHAVIALMLWGDGVAQAFDGRQEWRARFHLDEYAVHRLGRAVIRIGISLPFILLYALAPRVVHGLDDAIVALAALGLAGAGTWALFRMRTWGLLALAGATVALVVGAAQGGIAPAGPVGLDLGMFAAVAAILLGAALLPFVRPTVAFLKNR
jgi:hypothetical protein